jgi:hypothetical protein
MEKCVERLKFVEIFKVSNNELKQTTALIRDCFDCPGKLMKAHEFDLTKQDSYQKMIEYVRGLEKEGKQKIINLLFPEDNNNSEQQKYFESQYYMIHSHVVSVCLNLEEQTKKDGLVKTFIQKMRNSNKQRVINESSITIKIKDKSASTLPAQQDSFNGCLTLAQKIKMLINLNSI